MDDNLSTEQISEYLQVTFEAIDQAVTIYDADLRLVTWNTRYEHLGLVPDRFIYRGAPLREVYDYLAQVGAFGDGPPYELATSHIDALRKGKLIEAEVLQPPSGRLIRIRRFPLANGGVCATFSDVTEEVKTQEQLRQSTKMDAIGRLTGGAAHDFNNMLAIIYANLELALASNDISRIKSLLQASLNAAERGAKLTSRLLAFARKQPLSPTILRPSLILRDLVPMLQALIGEHIEIELTGRDSVWNIEVDANQLENVLVNLAANARDAMPDGGRLSLGSSNFPVTECEANIWNMEPGEYVCISCADTGIGMEANVLEQAFEPFFTTKSDDAGAGLGLSMAHGFVNQSNGLIKISSELDKGTVVRMYFPRAQGHPDEKAGTDVTTVSRSEAQTSVLVVEDNSELRSTIVDQLKCAGYIVRGAEDGAQALRIMDEGSQFDILLTDVVLPGGMNGREFAQEAVSRHAAVNVIYMSGYSKDAIVRRGRLDSNITLIQKPFRQTELLKAVANAANGGVMRVH